MLKYYMYSSVIVLAALFTHISNAANIDINGRVIATYSYFNKQKAENLWPADSDRDLFDIESLFNLELSSDSGNSRLRNTTYITYIDDIDIKMTELYTDFITHSDAYLMIGRKKDNWGNGIAWNPSNVINPNIPYNNDIKRPPLIEAEEGRDVVKYNYGFDIGSVDFYVLYGYSDQYRDIDSLWELAFRGTFILFNTEYNLAFLKTIDDKGSQIKNQDAVVWATYSFESNLTIFGDLSYSKYNYQLYPDPQSSQLLISNINQSSVSGLLGMSYQFSNGDIVRLEYYRNGKGYSQSLRNAYVESLNSQSSQSYLLPVFNNYNLGKQYAGFGAIHDDIVRSVDATWRLEYGLEDYLLRGQAKIAYHINDSFDCNIESIYAKYRGSLFQEYNGFNEWTIYGSLVWNY